MTDSEYQRRLSLSNNRYLTWNKQLKDFRSKVSILDDGKVIATSKQLLQKTLRTSKYSKIETKIKHTVSFLEEYSNYAVVPNEAVKDYSVGPLFEKIHFFEKSLRDFISSTLGEVHGDDWWLKAIPPDIRESEKKRKKAAILSPEDISTPLIQFINFAD